MEGISTLGFHPVVPKHLEASRYVWQQGWKEIVDACLGKAELPALQSGCRMAVTGLKYWVVHYAPKN